MPKSIVAVLVVCVLALLSGCDTLYPLKPVPHLEAFRDTSQLYCVPPLIWKVRVNSDTGKQEVNCELIDGRYGFYGSRETEPVRLPRFREISSVDRVFCRSPADWGVGFYPKKSENIAVICKLPESMYMYPYGWYPWGGVYPGYWGGWYGYRMW